MFRREIQWKVGYDYRNDPVKHKYGCHGMEIRFLLHGEKATVQLLLMTGWLPGWEPYKEEFKTHSILPADLGYHADLQQYEEQPERECDCRSSKRCFYDGSGLAAYEAFQILTSKGEDGLWKHMEEYYSRLKLS